MQTIAKKRLVLFPEKKRSVETKTMKATRDVGRMMPQARRTRGRRIGPRWPAVLLAISRLVLGSSPRACGRRSAAKVGGGFPGWIRRRGGVVESLGWKVR